MADYRYLKHALGLLADNKLSPCDDRFVIHLIYVSEARGFSDDEIKTQYELTGPEYVAVIDYYMKHKTRMDSAARENRILQKYLLLWRKPPLDEFDHLSKLLHDPLLMIRRDAGDELAATGDPRAIPLLIEVYIEALSEENNEDICEGDYASDRLREIGPEKVLPVLDRYSSQHLSYLRKYLTAYLPQKG